LLYLQNNGAGRWGILVEVVESCEVLKCISWHNIIKDIYSNYYSHFYLGSIIILQYNIQRDQNFTLQKLLVFIRVMFYNMHLLWPVVVLYTV